MPTSEEEYILGTHDDELARLGLQHRAWQLAVASAWRAAGIGPGQTVLDVGCGPGYATSDLAELVGPSGRVVAIDKSERFLSALEAQSRQRGLTNIIIHHADLDGNDRGHAGFPAVTADAAWCRWVFCFLQRPRDVLTRVASAIRPGGVIVIHEYFDYATWRTTPGCPEVEEFVGSVMASWRATGGEPDIALSLPGWLEELGFEVRFARPIVDIVKPGQGKWGWLRSFLDVGRRRVVDLGYLTASRAESIWQAFLTFEDSPGARMVTPSVLEVVAQKN